MSQSSRTFNTRCNVDDKGYYRQRCAPGSTPGREGFKQFVTMFRVAFSEISATVDDLISEGDKVIWRWTFRGTYKDAVTGVPATGKQLTFIGITIDRFAGGQIVKRWTQADFLGYMQQLGVIPAPGQGGE